MAADAVQFLSIIAKLKQTLRQGWVENDVKNPESVADHMYRMAVLCMMCPDPALDKNYMIRMALCHDMAEALVGDITPQMNVSKEVKYAKEKAGIEAMSGLIPGMSGSEMKALWFEYEAQETPESKFVRDMDLLEMIAQAHEYEKQQNINLQSFFGSGNKIVHPWAREILEHLDSTRPKGTVMTAAQVRLIGQPQPEAH